MVAGPIFLFLNERTYNDPDPKEEGSTSQDWFRFAPKKAEPVNDLFRLSTGSLTILRSVTNIAEFLKISDVLGILMQNQLDFCSRKAFSIT